MGISIVVKRNKQRVDFDDVKINNSVLKAMSSIYRERDESGNIEEARRISTMVVENLNSLKKSEVSVEEIQDIVEKVLMEDDPNVAKSFILYRKKRSEIRDFKAGLGIDDDELKMPINSLIVLSARYLKKDDSGKIIETPKQLFERVSNAIATEDGKYGKDAGQIRALSKEFYDAMTSFSLMPNSPTLMNAGTPLGQLSACFVLPIGDSIEEIFDTVKYAAMVHKSGGGTGFSASRLRPSNDIVKSTGGVASGPISFLKVIDAATEQIKQGGKRRGANMGILSVDHPDILNFIVAKESEGTLRNFNISVGITEEFMKALKEDRDYYLINPRSKKPAGRLSAKAVWNLIVTMAWKTGDPGLVFLDKINASLANPVPSRGPIEATNPCGEQPLYPYDSCNLASVNLAKMVRRKNSHYEVDWAELRKTARLGVHFLDNVIDANRYPLSQIDEVTKAIRRIGLGVMGWADMLIKLGIRYDSNEALALAEKVMSFITENARKMSEELAAERGAFPDFEKSVWHRLGYPPLRNSTVTTIAPTGTISIIAGGTSQGIEPIFSIVYMRNVHESLGYNLIEVNNEFERYAIDNGFYSEELMKRLAGMISIQEVEEIPQKIRDLFLTAHDIAPEWHVKMQAAFQKYVDNGVSKTINFPSWATPQDIEKAYGMAYDMGCRGITVYRDSSKSTQVLQSVDRNQKRLGSLRAKHERQENEVTMEQIRSGANSYVLVANTEKKCEECGSGMVAGDGCFTCPRCGFSLCE